MKVALNLLERAFQRHRQAVLNKQTQNDGMDLIVLDMNSDSPPRSPVTRTQIFVFRGPTGIGKTSAVREFAAGLGFDFVGLDCSTMPAAQLASNFARATTKIREGRSEGCVILIDNIDAADAEWSDLCRQYCDNAILKVIDESAAGFTQVEIPELPETLFLVGESRANLD